MVIIILGGFLVNQHPLNLILQQYPQQSIFIDINTINKNKNLDELSQQVRQKIVKHLAKLNLSVNMKFNNKPCIQVALMGFSMGGLVAIKLAHQFIFESSSKSNQNYHISKNNCGALEYQLELKQLILVNSSPKFIASEEWNGIELVQFNNLLHRLYQLSLSNFAKYFIQLASQPQHINSVETATMCTLITQNKLAELKNEDCYKRIYSNLLNILVTTDLRLEMYQLAKRLPIVMFYAQHDILVPYNGIPSSIDKQFSHFEQITLSNSTHLQLNAEILIFLQQQIANSKTLLKPKK